MTVFDCAAQGCLGRGALAGLRTHRRNGMVSGMPRMGASRVETHPFDGVAAGWHITTVTVF